LLRCSIVGNRLPQQPSGLNIGDPREREAKAIALVGNTEKTCRRRTSGARIVAITFDRQTLSAQVAAR
jgi:hypothetical protein